MNPARRIGLALALALLAGGAFSQATPITITFGSMLSFAALLILGGVASRRSPALLRLDWFVRALRRDPQSAASFGIVRRAAQRMLPAAFFSNREQKRRGWIRRGLRRLGISWLSSPVRRLVQAACLATFLLLFLYVCWPYSARPAAPAATSAGWQFKSLDEAGDVHFAAPLGVHEDSWIRELDPGQTIYLASSEDSAPASGWILQSSSKADYVFRPVGELPLETLDLLLAAQGTWTIHERDPQAWPTHYAEHLAEKEWAPAEMFLVIDPLVSISTAIAARSWVWSLTGAGVILLVCLLIPRGFCGYLCPLGTTIDLFDWAVAGRVQKFRVPADGWWVHIKYYLLAGILISAVMGVLLSGIFAAIPIITRGALFLLDPLQSGILRGWHLVPVWNWGHVVSLALFFGVLGLGFLRPRFWCKYVCPSGAVFSLGNLFRMTERKVESSCIHCNKCIEICPFDAIKPDFTTRTTDCTLCQSCAGVCPPEAIKFVERWNIEGLKPENDPPTGETALGRRGFLSLAAGGAAAIAGGVGGAVGVKAWGADLDNSDALIRPPGSVPEREFLQICIRCGECFKACPNNVLQPEGFHQGLEGLWAPMVVADWAGCESSCNNCGQVCPTGAIRALPMEEKQVARMGLAIVNEVTCLPFAGREACDLCVQECDAAGYHAIEFVQVGTQVDEAGQPIEGSGFLAPVVRAEACVGCGLCQTRCFGINVKERNMIDESAIVIAAGPGREDRIVSGSYRELRKQREQQAQQHSDSPNIEYYVPEASDPPRRETDENRPPNDDNPFGL